MRQGAVRLSQVRKRCSESSFCFSLRKDLHNNQLFLSLSLSLSLTLLSFVSFLSFLPPPLRSSALSELLRVRVSRCVSESTPFNELY
jgi:hypothetical protein